MNREDGGVRGHAGCTAVGVGQLDAGSDSDGIEGHGLQEADSIELLWRRS